jgi:hypothetical protein
MKISQIERDERTLAVENASYRLGYMVVSYGLLVLVMIRGFFYNQAGWDMLGLVILGGAVTTLYQAYNKVLAHRWLWLAAALFIISALVAAAFTLLLN